MDGYTRLVYDVCWEYQNGKTVTVETPGAEVVAAAAALAGGMVSR